MQLTSFISELQISTRSITYKRSQQNHFSMVREARQRRRYCETLCCPQKNQRKIMNAIKECREKLEQNLRRTPGSGIYQYCIALLAKSINFGASTASTEQLQQGVSLLPIYSGS